MPGSVEEEIDAEENCYGALLPSKNIIIFGCFWNIFKCTLFPVSSETENYFSRGLF